MTGQQLKNSILQMAVQGKLVPQDPNDEPASVLLERIRKEKERLVKEKKIKPDKNSSVIFRGSDNLPYEKIGKEVRCIADEVPFDIPTSWEWVRLGSITNYGECENADSTTIPQNAWILDLEDIEKDTGKILVRKLGGDFKSTKHHFVQGQLLYSKLRPYLNKVVIADMDGYCTSEIIPITVYGQINCNYLQLFLMSPSFVANAMAESYGVKMPRLGTNEARQAFVPIPPLQEQLKIVAMIDQITPIIEQYGVREKELAELNALIPTLLKKSILQQAIQGKLVPQDPNDEPASVLLERIRKEKARLVKEGKLKPDKHESVIFRRDNSHYEKRDGKEVCLDDEIPFEIPSSWSWVRLRTLLSKASTGPFGSMLHKSDYVEQGTPLVNPANIHDGEITIDGIKRVAASTATSLSAYLLDVGDVIIGRRGELGRSAVIRSEHIGWLCGTGCFFVTPVHVFLPEYLVFLLASPYVRDTLMSASVGTTMNNLNHDILKQLLIPLPPEKEQRKILQQYEKTCAFLSW